MLAASIFWRGAGKGVGGSGLNAKTMAGIYARPTSLLPLTPPASAYRRWP